ncbi:L-seryl-tRNA(Sec) selenium transferase [Abyssisolibacter fermentans]|uniref:L-seryl-tRNA(Sec) selenium transferase n=1 Tax=Abyssisolibacter fermentans TaxID=1766203 RepID=UPI00082DEADA|nr:L-seryl-tRNA(Sec) selenium transferase [Abyssisolibacter fermentans]
MTNKKLFNKLPKVDEILKEEGINNILKAVSRNIVLESVREEIDMIRNRIINNNINEEELEKILSNIIDSIIDRVTKKNKNKLQRVINCTGTIIHTNLGRSLISENAANQLLKVASSYSNLEYNLDEGKRGSRYSHIEYIIQKITGAEAAMVVNNNAAAVMLVLSTMAKNKEIIVSRGELVEIGGSFRIPDVMEQSGCKLVDVGTTNKTHPKDYVEAIGEETAALLKVHTSNYRIVGFTESVSLDELVSIGKEHNIPVIEDIGSGVLLDLTKYGLDYEPTVQESIQKGVDIVTFSGDKLLGGPQAGIIVGSKKYINKMKKNPLTRAIRVDKFTIAALETTLKHYLDENEAIEKIPTLRMLTMPINEIIEKAETLKNKLDTIDDYRFSYKIVDVYSQVGGGAMPLERIPSCAIEITSETVSVNKVEKELRKLDTPIIVRMYNDKIYIDLRTVDIQELNIIKNGFLQVFKTL